MKTNLEGLYNQPTPWRVYLFFKQGGGSIFPTPYGLQATFLEERDAKEYVNARQTDRITFKVINESELKNEN